MYAPAMLQRLCVRQLILAKSEKARYRGYLDKAQLLEDYVIHELKKQMFLVRISIKKKKERESGRALVFCYFRLFIISNSLLSLHIITLPQ